MTVVHPRDFPSRFGLAKTPSRATLKRWRKLGFPAPLVFETKSTSTARDLFYTYDTVGRFHAAQTGDGRPEWWQSTLASLDAAEKPTRTERPAPGVIKPPPGDALSGSGD